MRPWCLIESRKMWLDVDYLSQRKDLQIGEEAAKMWRKRKKDDEDDGRRRKWK